MESEWDWKRIKEKNRKGERNEIWRIWWTICTTRIKRKTK
jgi:hypothetical protein